MDHSISQTALLSKLLTVRFNLEDEKALQLQMEGMFTNEKIDHLREVRLSDKDIIDFMVGDVGIEVKIKGKPRDIYKQCCRYCDHEKISSLILITNKAILLPSFINTKRVSVLNMGMAWL